MSPTVVVTGGSRGIGRVCAGRLAHEGWRVVVVARASEQVSAAAASLPGHGHEGFALDVADGARWRELAGAVGRIEGLVCAAGIIGPIGRPHQVDPAEFARTLAVNVGGVFNAVCALELAADVPVVAFSGGGATGPMPRFDAYAASKAALVRLVENLSAGGLRINAVAPGFVVTSIQDTVLTAGRERVGDAYYDKVAAAVAEGAGEDPEIAAACVAWLLSNEGRGVAGRLISAPWDPWRDAGFADRLREDPDLATLRRIDDQFFARVPVPEEGSRQRFLDERVFRHSPR